MQYPRECHMIPQKRITLHDYYSPTERTKQLFLVSSHFNSFVSLLGKSEAEYPTLLHFACEYGLTELISTLLHYPGAYEACSMRNCNDQRPYNIAENRGFEKLANELRAFHVSCICNENLLLSTELIHYLPKFSDVKISDILFRTFLKFSDTFYLISDKFWTNILDTLLKHAVSRFTPYKMNID